MDASVGTPGTPAVRRLGPGVAAGVLAAAAILTLAATGNPLLALLFPIGAVALYGASALPTECWLFAAICLAMFSDIKPGILPNEVDQWWSVAVPVDLLLVQNLNKLTGIDALRFSGLELIFASYLILAVVSLGVARVRRQPLPPAARALAGALALELAGVLLLEGWGILRGGADIRQSLWQFRDLLWMPVVAWLVFRSIETATGIRRLFGSLTLVTLAKVALAFYYYFALARPLHFHPSMVTSHSDTVLFVGVMVTWIWAAVERPSLFRLSIAGVLSALLLVAIVINNRRTAFVTLAVCLVILFVHLPRRLRRRGMRALIVASPLIAVYLGLGATRPHGVFAPAAALMSVTKQKDASSQTRDIENYNLLVTLRPHPLLGSGWGHEYNEVVKADDISKFFAQYRYIAHNSVLWLWSIGGVIGFTLLWAPVWLSTFVAGRCHRLARSPDQRVTAGAGLLVSASFVLQTWADMGAAQWTPTLLFAMACAVLMRLSQQIEAPAPLSGFQALRPVHSE